MKENVVVVNGEGVTDFQGGKPCLITHAVGSVVLALMSSYVARQVDALQGSTAVRRIQSGAIACVQASRSQTFKSQNALLAMFALVVDASP